MTILIVMIGMMLASGIAGGIIGVMIDRWRSETRQLDTDIAEYEKRGRHACTQPRRQPERTSLVRGETPSPRPAQRPAEGGTEPSDWYTAISQDHVSAASIAPVILPAPDKYKPQPGRDSGAGTETMQRVGSTTGELIKLAGGAEEFRQQLSADNAAWLEEWSTPA